MSIGSGACVISDRENAQMGIDTRSPPFATIQCRGDVLRSAPLHCDSPADGMYVLGIKPA